MATQVDIRGNIAQAGSTQINNVNITAHTADDIDQICLRTLRCPDTLAIKNRLKENKGRLFSEPIEWILHSPQYSRWHCGNDVCLLWINGGAGKGKTVMSIGLIERLLQDDSAVVAYFFCQNADPELNTVEGIIKGFILRLIKQKKELGDSLRSRWDTKTNRFNESVASWRTLWDVLLEMLDMCRCRRVYMVVDALDECQKDGMADFLKLLVRTGLMNGSRVKWLLTSRPFPIAERELLNGHEQASIDLDLYPKQVFEAVKRYTSSKVAELAKRNAYGETLRQNVEVELSRKADGTYWWVSSVYKQLEETHRDDALSTIRSLQSDFRSPRGQITNKLDISEVGSSAVHPNDESIRVCIDQRPSLIGMQEVVIELAHQTARCHLCREGRQYVLSSHGQVGIGYIVLSCLFYISQLLEVILAGLLQPKPTIESVQIPKGNKQSTLLESVDYVVTSLVKRLDNNKRFIVVQNAPADQRPPSVMVRLITFSLLLFAAPIFALMRLIIRWHPLLSRGSFGGGRVPPDTPGNGRSQNLNQ